MMECELEGITLHYDVTGEGRPLLILPGWSASAHFTAYFMEPLFEGRPGWCRIYVDPPGHGRTEGPEWIEDMDGVLEVLTQFVDAVMPGENYAVAGWSAGAYLARGLLHHHKERIEGLFMAAPLIFPDDTAREVPPLTVVVEEPGLITGEEPEELEGLMAYVAVRTRAYFEQFVAYPGPPEGEDGDPAFQERIRQDPANYCCSFDVDALDEPFPKPTLIVAGRQDNVVGYRDAWKILENFPRATFVVFDRAGHFLEEKSDLNRALVWEWLDRVEEMSG
jgi:pimeloyl-ACP methyl ester carboxylesterase